MANKTKNELMEEIQELNNTINDLSKELEHYEDREAYKFFAEYLFAMKQEFVAAGFTDEEAFELLNRFNVNDARTYATIQSEYRYNRIGYGSYRGYGR